jgi:hypothetical protein
METTINTLIRGQEISQISNLDLSILDPEKIEIANHFFTPENCVESICRKIKNLNPMATITNNHLQLRKEEYEEITQIIQIVPIIFHPYGSSFT